MQTYTLSSLTPYAKMLTKVRNLSSHTEETPKQVLQSFFLFKVVRKVASAAKDSKSNNQRKN
jgi:hypothetical protein